MLSGGLLVGLGLFFPSFTFTSFTVGALLFVGFLIGRLLSLTMEGKPNQKISQGMLFELILGAANVFGLFMEVAIS